MRAVILAGGKGTRLRPYTTILPKPLLPLGERPILDLVVGQLIDAGFTRIDLCVGHLGNLIRAYFEEGSPLPEGIEMNYHFETEPMGTAGALRLIGDVDEPFLVMNGDILTDIDYAGLVERHKERGVALTIASCKKDIPLSLGVIESTGEIVTGYVEKPTLDYRVSMGIYVYDPSVLDVIPEGHFDFPEVVLALIEAGRPVGAYHFDGAWFDVGTADEYERAAGFLMENEKLFETKSRT
jgi:NDP-sugar pyrophosphorylase family protein